jgi:hypothetical protein
MSKKKLSKNRTINKQAVNKSKKINATPKKSILILVLRFLGKQLASIVFKAIFEQPVKDLLFLVVNWIRSI